MNCINDLPIQENYNKKIKKEKNFTAYDALNDQSNNFSIRFTNLFKIFKN